MISITGKKRFIYAQIISSSGAFIPALNPRLAYDSLSLTVEVADGFWTRFRGLMGHPTIPVGFGLLLVPCKQIHTFGMRFPLDVLYIDSADEIIDIEAQVKPGQIQRYRPQCAKVLELLGGTLDLSTVNIGDKLLFA